jgi:hypothetical protein
MYETLASGYVALPTQKLPADIFVKRRLSNREGHISKTRNSEANFQTATTALIGACAS